MHNTYTKQFQCTILNTLTLVPIYLIVVIITDFMNPYIKPAKIPTVRIEK